MLEFFFIFVWQFLLYLYIKFCLPFFYNNRPKKYFHSFSILLIIYYYSDNPFLVLLLLIYFKNIIRIIFTTWVFLFLDPSWTAYGTESCYIWAKNSNNPRILHLNWTSHVCRILLHKRIYYCGSYIKFTCKRNPIYIQSW